MFCATCLDPGTADSALAASCGGAPFLPRLKPVAHLALFCVRSHAILGGSSMRGRHTRREGSAGREREREQERKGDEKKR